jgi:hypothetical protein
LKIFEKGIYYNPDTPNVNDTSEQLVLVYVTFNEAIVDVLFVLQPEGGFHPLGKIFFEIEKIFEKKLFFNFRFFLSVLMQPWCKFQIFSA